MERKFLVFSCFVLLTSIAYFIYTSYQWNIKKNKNLQEVVVDEGPSAGGALAIRSESPSYAIEFRKLGLLHPNSTLEEREAFEVTNRDLDGSEEQEEATQLEFPSEIIGNKVGISPELEILFTGVKSLIDQLEVIRHEAALYVEEHAKLKYRQIDIGTRGLVDADKASTEQLHEEFRRNQERMKQLMDWIRPFEEQKRQLANRFEEEYNMTFGDFKKKYNGDYRLWKASL